MKTMTIRLYSLPAVLLVIFALSGCERRDPGVFESPEEAVQAAAGLIGTHDDKRIEEVFGPGSADMFASGDEAADQEDFQRVGEMIAAGVAFEEFDENTLIALLGEKSWPWPIPLVREGDGWRFDTAAGREELLNRRIGRNELWVLAALHEVVDAQREYRSEPRDGNPPAFAQRFRSTEGKHDGLYWGVADDEAPSPLGDVLAESETTASEPQPFHGYFFRMLTSRGAHAPGGAKDYVDEQGLMTGGFGVVAWPAKYGNSGVMTFLISERGMAFQKDLGAETETAVAGITSFDPDASWTPTGDTMLQADSE